MRIIFTILSTLLFCFYTFSVYAHSPLCDCFDNGDGSVTCEGGFSDGASADGVDIRVLDLQDKVLLAGKMDSSSSYTFNVPADEYYVVFDAGKGHLVTIYSGDIEE